MNSHTSKTYFLSNVTSDFKLFYAEISVDMCRKLAIAVILIQCLGVIVATAANLMLHADGSFFVYALSVDAPWVIKWQALSARASTYTLTVLPTQYLAHTLLLTPLDISRLNGFIFYFVPCLQFIIACMLVWKSHPKLLVFPVIQYVFSSVLGFGFPSEILLAPGFLWIALFLSVDGKPLKPLLLLSLLGLVLAHELAIPAALVAMYHFFQQARQQDKDNASFWRTPVVAIFSVIIIGIFVALRSSGGGTGSDAAAKYVFDPRRILNDPTLYIMLAAMALVVFAIPIFSKTRTLGWKIWSISILVALLLPIIVGLLVPSFNFQQGRYDTARTLIGGTMLVLAFIYNRLQYSKNSQPVIKSDTYSYLGQSMPLALCVGLAIACGSASMFVKDWLTATNGLERVITAPASGKDTIFISYKSSLDLMTPEEREANEKIGFQWVMPYRSIVLANESLPTHIVYEDTDYQGYCKTSAHLSSQYSKVSPDVMSKLHAFTCSYVPSPSKHETRDKIMKFIHGFIH
jgi:hypothetical protein